MFASATTFVPLTFFLALQLGFSPVSGAPSFLKSPSTIHRRHLAARHTTESWDAQPTDEWSSSESASETGSIDSSAPSPSDGASQSGSPSESWDSSSSAPESTAFDPAWTSASADNSSVAVATAVATAWTTSTSVYTESTTIDASDAFKSFSGSVETTWTTTWTEAQPTSSDYAGFDSPGNTESPASPSDSGSSSDSVTASPTQSSVPPTMTAYQATTLNSEYTYDYNSAQRSSPSSEAAAAAESSASASSSGSAGGATTPVSAAASDDSSDKFWSNTGAVAGTFAGVGVFICIVLLVVGYYKRQKTRPHTINFGRFSKLPEANDTYPQEKATFTPAPPAPAYSAQHYQQEQAQMRPYRDVEERGHPTYQYDGYDFAMVSGYHSRNESEAPMPLITPLNPRRSPSPPSLTPTRRAPSPPEPVRYNHTRTPSPTTPPAQVRRYQPPSTYDLFTVPPPAPRPTY
ncbi:hypothetical protein HDZ31DRAFT_48489, partial [Schizophyllum fasciatum]